MREIVNKINLVIKTFNFLETSHRKWTVENIKLERSVAVLDKTYLSSSMTVRPSTSWTSWAVNPCVELR